MEQEYSVGTTNRYALFLDEDDDPGDVVVTPSTKPEKDASGKAAKEKGGSKQQSKGTKGKENKERIAKEQQSKKAAIENAAKAAQDKNVSGGRGQKAGGRGGDRERQDNRRPPSGEVKERDDRPPRGQNAGGRRQRLPSKEKERDVEGGGYSGGFSGDREGRGSRGRGGPRPFRGGRGGFRGGKREFERRSGSDRSSVKATEKREGGGAHNWGKADDLEVNEDWPSEEAEPGQEQKEPTTNGETAPQEAKGDAEEPEKEQEPTPEEEEEGPREMTLEEYKQKHSTVTVKSELSVRKAGENVDGTQWKDTIQLQKDEEEFFPGTREVIEKVKTSGRIKTTLESHFFFKEPARRGRGRSGGGRGNFEGSRGGFDRGEGGGGGRYEGGRGGGGRGQGGGRRFNRRDRAPNVEDERDFPSLGPVEVM